MSTQAALDIPRDEYLRILSELVDTHERKPSNMLTIPGVFEAVAEDYHNAVVAHWEQEQDNA